MIYKSFLFFLVFLSGMPIFAKQYWQHSPSPYRAIFECKIIEKFPMKTGLILTIPDCNTTLNDGEDVFCFDQNNKRLFQRKLGKGVHNTTLMLAIPEWNTKTIYTYWGSRQNAPTARIPYYSGLLVEMRSLPDLKATTWSRLQPLLKKSTSYGLFASDTSVIMNNSINDLPAYIYDIKGFISVPSVWKEEWFVSADDSGYFLIDDILQIARPGENYVYSSLRGEFKKEITLKRGIHNAELIGVNFKGESAIALGKMRGKQTPAIVKEKDFLFPGKAVFLEIEARKNAELPQFTYKHLSYTSLNDHAFIKTEYTMRGDTPGEWSFEDGLKMTGQKIVRIHTSSSSCKVNVRCGDRRSSGQTDFPTLAPEQFLSADTISNYEDYAKLLKIQWLNGMQKKDILSDLECFFEYADFRPELIPILEKTIQEGGLLRKKRWRSALLLARSAAIYKPKLAQQLYEQILPQKLKLEKRADIVTEAVEFAIYRIQDYKLAEYWLRQYGLAFNKEPQKLLGLKMDLAFAQKNLSEAQDYYKKIWDSQLDDVATILHHAVQSNAKQAKIQVLLKKYYLLRARQFLQDWLQINPGIRLNGSYSLLRAQLWHAMGWEAGAIQVLDAAIQMDPLLPNLPEIEMLKADILWQTDQKYEARQLYQKIVKDFPNHPVAKDAEKRAK